MKSTTNVNRFSEVPAAEISRSTFNRSHGHKTTFNAGDLVPIFVDEALPGDTFSLNMQGFARLATPLHPIMDNLFMHTFFFAVPYRLLWENWERFNGAQDDPGDSTDFLIPQVLTTWAAGSVGDHFGIPTAVPTEVNALPFRALNLIYNDWFRDQNLQPSLPVLLDDGPDAASNYVIYKRNKQHDYFTSALPWPQKGDSVELPLGTRAPVMGIGVDQGGSPPGPDNVNETARGNVVYADGWDSNSQTIFVENDPLNTNNPGIYADLTAATAATINQLRQAFQIQRLYERDARGGTRYTEIIQSHFGVSSPDARLQRPEYLGGGSSFLEITPIPQTSSTTDGTGPVDTPQGNLAAQGTASLVDHGFSKSFTEHCIVIGFINVRADLTYQQGLNRMWSRRTRWDHFWPALQHIGEQQILNKELYADGSANDDLVFAYQERFAEYRYKPSTITGEFRSNFATSLDTWHLAEDFGVLPTLSSTFMESNPPIDRIVAVPSSPDFLLDTYFNFNCVRPMPVYGVPGFIDHF